MTTISEIERMSQLGTYIREHAEGFIAEWEEEALRENPEAGMEQREAMRNRVPDFLRSVGERLLGHDPAVPRSYASEHGTHRWQLGWSIESLVRDYLILRRLVVAGVREAIGLSIGESMILSSIFDEATATSVAAYVEMRDDELRQKNEELERANADLQRFAHMLAHEIRNALAVIQMAAEGVKDADHPLVREFAPHLLEGVRTARQIVVNLLAFAKAEGAHVQKGPVDLQRVLEEIRRALADKIKERQAQVLAWPMPIIQGNERLLRQVLENLVENGIKYAGDKPPVVRVACVEHVGHWLISVHDEGIGIPEEKKDAIFEFLTRAHAHLGLPGSGIGLALCKRVVEAHGGRIWVESSPGQGSTFFFTLPKATATGHAADTPKSLQPAERRIP